MIYLKEGRTPLNFAYSDEIVHDGNSTYQLSFKFPTNNPLWEELVEETLLLADDLHGEQEFIIFEVEKHHAYITVHANQVATLLNNYSITELSVNNASGDRVLRSLVGSIIREHKFTFSSDIASMHSINLKNVTVATALFKDKHSILGQWGGDLIRDKYDIRLLSNGGTNKEALFMYKKNLKSYQQKKSIKDLRTRIHFTKTINSQKNGEKDKVIAVTVDSPLISKYKNIYEGNIDVNDQDIIDEVTLRKYGEQYFKTTLCDVIEESIEIDVVGNLDVPVNIFDTVTVFHEKFNLDVKKKITKYTYTPMGRKLKTIGFGKIQQGLGTTLASMIEDAVTEHVESKVDAFKIQKNLSELLKLDRKSIEDKLVDLEEKSNSALEVKRALFEADGNIPEVVRTKILDAVEAEVGRLKTIITEAELIKAIQAKLNYAEIKNTLIDKAFINQIISDERFTQQFKDGEVTTQNIFTKLKDSIKSNISKDFITKEGVKKLVNDLTIDADGIRQITQQESSKVFENKKAELKGVDSYIHRKYSDYADGRNMSDNSTLKYIGIYTGDKQQAPTNASEYSWTKIRGEDGRDGVDGKSINRNYITDSDKLNTKPHWGSNKWDETVDGDTIILTKKGGSDTTGFFFVLTDLVKTQFQNETLTWSIDVKASRDMTLNTVGFETNGLRRVDISTQWKRISHTFINKFTNYYAFVFYHPTTNFNNGDKIYIRLPKLEKGSVASEWSPAYEDLKGRDGVSSYIYRKYSDNANGSPMSDNSNLKYIGIYTGTSATAPTTPSAYTWSKIKGEDGANGRNGTDGHSLTANLRFEGTYINNITNNVKAYLDVFYDGKKVSGGFNVQVKYKGGNRTDWSIFWTANIGIDGGITNLDWGNREQNGTPLEVIVLVTYKGLNTVANARMENIPDVVEIKEITKKYKTFESTIDRFDSTIGEVKQQVLANEEKRNLILGSRMISESDYKNVGNADLTPSQEYEGLPFLSIFSTGKTSKVWQGVGFNLSIEKIKRFETYTIKIPIFISDSLKPDEGAYLEIKNHNTGEVLWNTRLDSAAYPLGQWNVHEYIFQASKDMNLSKASFCIYIVKNGYLAFAKPHMCEGTVAPKKYSPAPEDVYLQNSRIESSIIQTKNEIDLKVSKDEVIASINASVEKNEQGQNQGIVKIRGEVIADNIHGKIFTGSKFEVGKSGFLDSQGNNLRISSPHDWNGSSGVGMQLRGRTDGKFNQGLNIYRVNDVRNPDEPLYTPDEVALTVFGEIRGAFKINTAPRSGTILSKMGRVVMSNISSNNPVKPTGYSGAQLLQITGIFLKIGGGPTQLWVNDGTGSNSTFGVNLASMESDVKLKENISISNHSGLDIINKFTFHSFDWKKDKFGYRKPHTKIGLIAQEVQEIQEDLVYENPNALALDEFRLLNIALKAIQELSTENQQLKSQLKEMNERLTKLEDKINGNI